MDGDPPAAMRYTEARLSQLSGEVVKRYRQKYRRFRLEF